MNNVPFRLEACTLAPGRSQGFCERVMGCSQHANRQVDPLFFVEELNEKQGCFVQVGPNRNWHISTTLGEWDVKEIYILKTYQVPIRDIAWRLGH